MKKLISILSVVVLSTLTTLSLDAQVLGQSNEAREYMVSLDDMHSWSCGFYYKTLDRDLAGGWQRQVSMTRDMFYVGYDPIDWLTLYVNGGIGKTKVDKDESANNGVFGAGARLSIIDKEIMDPTLIENRLRVTAGMEYTATQAQVRYEKTDFNEFSANLLLTLSNDLEGNKDYLPNSIALFIGPEYSNYMTDDDTIDEAEALGLLYGMQVFYTESVSLNLSASMYDEAGASGFNAGVHVRF